jgi:hypothetical protein
VQVLEWLFAPTLYDLILVILVCEGAWLSRRFHRTGRGMPPLQLATFLTSGAGLALTCRALAALWPPWTVAASLTAALIAHLLYLRAQS